jgi:hypothetical protein
MRKSNFALRLQPSLLEEARKVVETEGVALNQLVNVAVVSRQPPPMPRLTGMPSSAPAFTRVLSRL